MDEFSRVRDLAPDTTVGEDAVATARRRLMAQIAEEKAPARRPAARVIAAARRPRWGMPAGVLAAVAAVVVVALIAAGAVLVAQWMPRPAPSTNDDTGTLDLGRPLVDQVPDGGYLRILTTAETNFIGELEDPGAESGVREADGYLRIRSVDALYAPVDGGPWRIAGPESETTVIDGQGPDADALVAGEGWLSPPSITTGTDFPAVDPTWVEALPTDADGIIAAFAERYFGPTDGTGSASFIAQSMLGDAAPWYIAAPDQRRGLLDAVRDAGATVTEQPDGDLLVEVGGPYPSTTLVDGESLLPLSGSSAAVDAGGTATGLPAPTWSVTVSIATEAPDEAVPDAEPGDGARCNGTLIPGEAFALGTPLSELDDAGQAALEGREVPGLNPDEWFVVSQSADELLLMSTVIHQETQSGDGATHELLTIRRTGSEWALDSWQGCRLETVLDGLGSVDVALDPAHPPAAEETALHLLVTERACNSGQDAAGRIQVVTLNEADDVVEVLLGVTPREGAAECQSNPPTAFVLELAEPLGDRPVYSLTYLDPTELRPPQ